uniref:Uncharacterized protein n=1 Tax=Magallana gigas TaxID=29159 RepID=A0A8W8L942_MAGGI|nr:uncharacterized protein LOC105319215 isoform X3 [Crassostrea gigas]XP_019919248.2 uncharacterized protein LOC105319215 isoform X3 [Crassostrea gigas]
MADTLKSGGGDPSSGLCVCVRRYRALGYWENDATTSSNSKRDSGSIPTYAYIDRKPPPSPSSVHNGRTAPKKFVTLGGYVPQNTNFSAKDGTTPGNGTATRDNNRFHCIYSTYNPRRQDCQQGPPIVQRLFAFSTDFSQPTPYSTLKAQNEKPPIPKHHHQQQQQLNNIPQSKSGFRSSFEERYYDNQIESMPLMIENQQSLRSKTSFDETFEPTPLVYPSARRPITFDKISMSSSKTSIYDNVHCAIDLDTFKLDREKD